MKIRLLFVTLLVIPFACETWDSTEAEQEPPFVWENANIYFLLTDRFYNGDPSNDVQFDRKQDGGVLRDFKGGDLKGITQKIRNGYFSDLGINAIWFTPPFEQIHGSTDEGTGNSYGYHGYWMSDWTNIDPNFGTHDDLKELVQTAHDNGIRIILDVVINHTGPVTPIDPVWPEEWVRTEPACNFQNFEGTVSCTLVENLPDIRTESNDPVDLPPQLVAKWKAEGRYEQEVAELDAFFARTGLPRAPRFYIMKWVTDYVREYGIDGFRIDTAKHTEIGIWSELYNLALAALSEWRLRHPDEVLDDNPFFMMGEVYGYTIHSGRTYDMGDTLVNFYENGFKSLINFSFKDDANQGYEELFATYDRVLGDGALRSLSTVNYISSHDDGSPFDQQRTRSMEAATKLLLTPGATQVYYGDELARPLSVEGAKGDAHLRSLMNWEQLEQDSVTQNLFNHWAKLGKFRSAHPAIGAGRHQQISESPYTFSRMYKQGEFDDKVVVSLDNAEGTVNVAGVFPDGSTVVDHYSGAEVIVEDGLASFENASEIILLALK